MQPTNHSDLPKSAENAIIFRACAVSENPNESTIPSIIEILKKTDILKPIVLNVPNKHLNQKCSYIIHALITVLLLCKEGYFQENIYAQQTKNWVSDFTMEQAKDLYEIVTKAKNFPPIKEERLERAKQEHKDRCSVKLTDTAHSFWEHTQPCFKAWSSALQERIQVLEKAKSDKTQVIPVVANPSVKNDLIEKFEQWAAKQPVEKTQKNIGLARTFITKTSGTQDFINSKESVFAKYRSGRVTQDTVIKFWNECVGEYKNGKFIVGSAEPVQTPAPAVAKTTPAPAKPAPVESQSKPKADLVTVVATATYTEIVDKMIQRSKQLDDQAQELQDKIDAINVERAAIEQKLQELQSAKNNIAAAQRLFNQELLNAAQLVR